MTTTRIKAKMIEDWVDDISFDFNDVVTGTIQTWILDINASYSYRVISTTLQSDTAMDSVKIQINGSAIAWSGFATSIDVTTSAVETYAEAGYNNLVELGNQITLVTSGTDDGSTLIRGKLKIQRI